MNEKIKYKYYCTYKKFGFLKNKIMWIFKNAFVTNIVLPLV